MDDKERLTALIEDADRLPYEEQVPLLLSALELADASGDEAAQVAVRMGLAQAQTFGDGERLPETLGWLLDRLDAGRITDEADVDAVLWMNKWLVGALLDVPDTDLSRAREAVAEMRARYGRHRRALQPVLKSEYILDAHVLGEAEASDAYAAWVGAERTDLSDCEACEPTTMARHLSALGRHAEAVAAAERVLAGELGCAEEPEDAISVLLPSLVAVGRGEEAAELHALSWRAVRDRSAATSIAGRLIGFCARTHNLGRGVELLRARWRDLTAPASPEAEMEFCAHASALCRALVAAGHADLPLVPGERARDAADRLRARARELARQFDRRNGTGAIGDVVEAILAAPDLGPVDLGAVGRHPLSEIPVPERSSMPGSPDLRALDLTDIGALAAAIEAADHFGGEAEVLRITAAWEVIRAERLAALATSEDSWQLTAAALLEVRGYVALRAQDPADERLVHARDLYRRAGLTGEALLVEERMASAAGDRDRIRAIVGQIDRIGTLEEVMRAQLMALRGADDSDEASRLADALTSMAPAARESWRIRALIAAASAERVEEDPLLALATVEQALGLLQPDELPDERGGLLLARGVLLDELERPAEASASVVEAGRLAWDAGCPTLWAQALTYRAQAATAGDDLAAAEALLAEASAAAAEARQRQPAGQLILNQAAVLSALGRPVQAAEIAERALGLLDDPVDRASAAGQAGEYAADIGDLRRAREFAALAVREHAALGPSGSAFAALGELGHLAVAPGRRRGRAGDVRGGAGAGAAHGRSARRDLRALVVQQAAHDAGAVRRRAGRPRRRGCRAEPVRGGRADRAGAARAAGGGGLRPAPARVPVLPRPHARLDRAVRGRPGGARRPRGLVLGPRPRGGAPARRDAARRPRRPGGVGRGVDPGANVQAGRAGRRPPIAQAGRAGRRPRDGERPRASRCPPGRCPPRRTR